MAILDSKDTKLVNVYTRSPIRSMSGLPIRSSTRSIKLSISDIHACIIAKAKVEEVLIDGSVLILNLANYNKDNNAEIKAKLENKVVKEPELVVVKKTSKTSKPKKEVPVVETPVEPTPVIEETPVVEETVEEVPTEEVVEPVNETEETPEEQPAPKKRNRRKKSE